MKVGMGWLGWSEEQTLDASMPAIILAYEGRVDMINAIFGGPKDESAEMSPDQIRDAFRALK
jgi:hypothetical protein